MNLIEENNHTTFQPNWDTKIDTQERSLTTFYLLPIKKIPKPNSLSRGLNAQKSEDKDKSLKNILISNIGNISQNSYKYF